MRPLGAGLLALAGLLAGFFAVGELSRRARRAGELSRLIDLMAYEIGRFSTPLPALFEDLAHRTEGAAAQVCARASAGLAASDRPFRAVWDFACGGLTGEERALLLPLGPVLGRYGAAEQAAALEKTGRALERYHEERLRARRERGRLTMGLWTAAGLFAAVLLW